MAINAITKIAADWYTPESEREEENPTRFKIQPLNGLQHMEVLNDLYKSGPFNALRYGLVGWENFSDENGKEIKFSAKNIERIPPLLLSELSTEIVNRSELGEDATKN